MDAQAFRGLLLTLRDGTDSGIRKEAEAQYFAYRAQTPSDGFVQLIVGEIVNGEDQNLAEFACVLLRQDIDTNDDKCTLCRMSDQGAARALIVQLMHFAAQNPNRFLTQVIASYAKFRLFDEGRFDEVFQFVQQAYEADSARVQEMAVQIVAELCRLSPGLFPFSVLELLNRALLNQNSGIVLDAAKALKNMLEYDNVTQTPSLSQDVKREICRGVTTRMFQFIDEGQYEMAGKIAQVLIDMTDSAEDVYAGFFPWCLQQVQGILLNGTMPEPLKARLVCLVDQVIQSDDGIYKNCKEMVLQFACEALLPYFSHSLEDESELQSFASRTTIRVDQFEDDTVITQTDYLMQTIAKMTGKQKMYGVVVQLLNTQGNPIVVDRGANLVKTVMPIIGKQLKNNELNQMMQLIFQLIQQSYQNQVLDGLQRLRYRYDMVELLPLLCDVFEDKMMKYQQQYFGTVFAVYAADRHTLMTQLCITALSDFSQNILPETFYAHKEQLEAILAEQFSGASMEVQTELLELFEVCLKHADAEDSAELLTKFMPGMLERLQEVTGAVSNEQQLNHEQVQYVKGLLQAIQTAQKRCPELFRDAVIGICESFVIIMERSYTQRETELLAKAAECLHRLVGGEQRLVVFLPRIYCVAREVLQTNATIVSEAPTTEGNMAVDDQTAQAQVEVLYCLSELLQKHPKAFLEVAKELIQLLDDFDAVTDSQQVCRLQCYAAVLAVFLSNPVDFVPLNAKIYQIFQQQFAQLNHCDLTQIADLADAVSLYITNYAQYLLNTADMQQYQLVVPPLLGYLAQTYHMIKDTFRAAVQEIFDDSQLDDDQRRQDLEDLYEDLDDALDCLCSAYSEFIMHLGDRMECGMLDSILAIANEMMSAGIESDPSSMAFIHATDLLNDIAQFASPEVAKKVFNDELLNKLMKVLYETKERQDETFGVAHGIYQCLTTCMEETQDLGLANNQDLLSLAVELLGMAKEGDEEGLQLYDTLCLYLVVAGDLAGQQEEFWSSLSGYCMSMQVDFRTIKSVVQVYVARMKQGKLQDEQHRRLVLKLFFGTGYGEMMSKDDKTTLIEDVRELLRGMDKVAEELGDSDPFVRKNWKVFWSNERHTI